MAIEDILTNLLTEIKGLRSDLVKGTKAASASASADATPAKTATATKPAATPAKDKAAAATKPGAPAATAKPAAAGGKYDEKAVRDAVRDVATNKNLGKQAALDILDEDGGGVQNVTQLKPELYDAVVEACKVAIAGAGKTETTPAADPDDPLA